MRGHLGTACRPGGSCCRTSAAGGRSYLLDEKPTTAQLQQVLAQSGIHPTLEVLAGETGGWLHVLHRVKAGQDVFLVCNQNHQGAARQFKFRATAAGEPECWDAVRNEITSLPFRRTAASQVEFSLTLEPLESLLIVFSPKRQPRPLRIEAVARPLGEPIIVTRDANATPPEPVTARLKPPARPSLKGAKWIWFPEGNPAVKAPVAERYFRQTITLPADRKIKKASFVATADNAFELFVNGKPGGANDLTGGDLSAATAFDITKQLHAGANVLAVDATNGGDEPNPAGLVGRLVIQFEQGPPLIGITDKTWKTTQREEKGWTELTFDDSAWVAAMELTTYGGPPWGLLNERQFTIGPVKAADPFRGHFSLPADVRATKCRLCLEMEALPDDSAAVRITARMPAASSGGPRGWM